MDVNPLKRQLADDEQPLESPLNLKGTQFLPTPTPTVGSTSSEAMTDRRPSPAPSESDLSSIQDVSSIAPQDAHSTAQPSTIASTHPAKRRKLTPAEKVEREAQKQAKEQEKEAKRQEREVKKQEQAELKAKRDEEKHIKDVERQKKAEEREAKKREKELEEERRAQEKLKKERSQMRLGAFFQAPAVTSNDPEMSSTIVAARRRSLSLESYDAAQVRRVTIESPTKPEKPQRSEYHRHFLPFEIRPHTSMFNACAIADAQLETCQRTFDHEIQQNSTGEQYDVGLQSPYPDLRACFSKTARRGITPSVRDLHKATSRTDKTAPSSIDPITALSAIPVRYIHFQEDVRPPYFGTFTSVRSPSALKSARSKPFIHYRVDTKYDYDSEAEWEESEGEDCDNEDDDDESVDDGQEMEEFLDDENDELANRRRVTVSDLVPHTTGMCWQDQCGKQDSTVSDTDRKLLSGLQMQILLPNFTQGSIDPFSSSYWHVSKSSEIPEPTKDELNITSARLPLAERSSNAPSRTAESAWPIQVKEQGKSGKRGQKAGTQKTMSISEFEEFKLGVVGSLLGKQELLAKLKDAFPKLTTVLIKDTLSENFAQVGKSKADKKWLYVGMT